MHNVVSAAAKLMGMWNISGGEFLILAFIALVLIGPERLPQYAEQLGRLVRTIKEMMTGARTTLREELGDDYDELAKFDPRQYDPRRIVREAMLEDVVPATKPAASRTPVPPPAAAKPRPGAEESTVDPGGDERVPFDDEAT